MNNRDYYQSKLNSKRNELVETGKKLRINSIARLLLFLLIFIFLFGISGLNKTAGFSGSLISLILFLALVKRHLLLQKNKSFQERYLSILEMEILAIDYKWKSFQNGQAYSDHHHSYSYDLDIIGHGSLFQYLNRTVTHLGQQYLVEELVNETLDKEIITGKQETIKELSADPDILEKFRIKGMLTDDSEDDVSALSEWLGTRSYTEKNRFISFVRIFLPALLVLSIMAIPFWFSAIKIFTSLFIINLIIIGFYFKKTTTEHQLISRRLNIIKKYQELLEIMVARPFKSVYLQNIIKKTEVNGENAVAALKKLSKYVASLDSRLNVLVAMLLEGFLLWDFHWLIKINNWKKRHINDLLLWIDQIGRFDKFVTLGTFAFNHQNLVYPVVSEEINLNSKDLGHILIQPDRRICNDFKIENQDEYIIITGANMAGKSTFLRTVGLNLVMAMSGLPVCASTFIFKPRYLYTSMRTSDSLSDDESYFYAELKRLKELFDRLESGEELFIILDEILKGTNSVDKQKGSRAALEKVLRLNGTGLIATHDLKLTEIEKDYPDKISNKCFEIEIDNANIYFDYKLTDGVTKKMNASLLMKQMGILE